MNCKIKNCKQEYHARGFCNQHYNEFLKNEGLEGLPVVPREEGSKNFSYKINEDMINNLYIEAVRTVEKPLYRAINEPILHQMLTLAINLAGCHSASRLFMAEMIEELRTCTEAKDKTRFTKVLKNWQQKQEDFVKENKSTNRANLFQLK